jgi:hypothetical protein
LNPFKAKTLILRRITVFITVPLAFVAIIWFMLPETNGLSLEEVGALFGDEIVIETNIAVQGEMVNEPKKTSMSLSEKGRSKIEGKDVESV